MADAPAVAGAAPAPLRGYNFRLDVDGYTGYFTRCTGLAVRVHPIAYREGGAGPEIRQLAGPVECAEVTLCYGVIPGNHIGLWTWLQSAMTGEPVRKCPSVLLLDHQNNETMRYNLHEAWPVEWRAASLDALTREVAIESLTLVFERIERG